MSDGVEELKFDSFDDITLESLIKALSVITETTNVNKNDEIPSSQERNKNKEELNSKKYIEEKINWVLDNIPTSLLQTSTRSLLHRHSLEIINYFGFIAFVYYVREEISRILELSLNKPHSDQSRRNLQLLRLRMYNCAQQLNDETNLNGLEGFSSNIRLLFNFLKKQQSNLSSKFPGSIIVMQEHLIRPLAEIISRYLAIPALSVPNNGVLSPNDEKCFRESWFMVIVSAVEFIPGDACCFVLRFDELLNQVKSDIVKPMTIENINEIKPNEKMNSTIEPFPQSQSMDTSSISSQQTKSSTLLNYKSALQVLMQAVFPCRSPLEIMKYSTESTASDYTATLELVLPKSCMKFVGISPISKREAEQIAAQNAFNELKSLIPTIRVNVVDHKGELNKLASQRFKTTTSVKYQTIETDTYPVKYRCTVTIDYIGLAFNSRLRDSKKAAEQSAAEVAVRYWRTHLL